MDLSYLTLQNSDISPFLSALPPELLDVCRPVRFPKDAVVVERDAPVDRVFILLSGEFATFNETADGKLSSFLAMPAPDIIGDMEVLAAQKIYAANVMASADSFALRCPSEAFRSALARHPGFLREAARIFAGKTFRISYQRGGAAFHTGLEKVALFLIHECALQPPAPGRDTAIRWTRPTMASKIVVSQKTVDRGVYELRDRGYLTLQKGKIHISAGQYRRLLSDWWKSDTPPDQVHPAEVP